jgi:hypothetical protein
LFLLQQLYLIFDNILRTIYLQLLLFRKFIPTNINSLFLTLSFISQLLKAWTRAVQDLSPWESFLTTRALIEISQSWRRYPPRLSSTDFQCHSRSQSDTEHSSADHYKEFLFSLANIFPSKIIYCFDFVRLSWWTLIQPDQLRLQRFECRSWYWSNPLCLEYASLRFKMRSRSTSLFGSYNSLLIP